MSGHWLHKKIGEQAGKNKLGINIINTNSYYYKKVIKVFSNKNYLRNSKLAISVNLPNKVREIRKMLVLIMKKFREENIMFTQNMTN